MLGGTYASASPASSEINSTPDILFDVDIPLGESIANMFVEEEVLTELLNRIIFTAQDTLEGNKIIDKLTHLKDNPVYIFGGEDDTVVASWN